VKENTAFLLNVIIMSVIKTSIIMQNAALEPTYCAGSGSTSANMRKPKTCLGQVFNLKLGCFDGVHVIFYADTWPNLQFKTRPRFSPVS
jgi:hypothetical protein